MYLVFAVEEKNATYSLSVEQSVLSPVRDPVLDPKNPAPSGQSVSLIQAVRAPPSGPQVSGRVIQVWDERLPRSTH